MDADLDLLLTAVFVTADDLLPERQKNAARRVTDAEVVTCVWLRRSWGSRPTAGSWRSPANASGICSRCCPSSRVTSNAVAGWRTRWSG